MMFPTRVMSPSASRRPDERGTRRAVPAATSGARPRGRAGDPPRPVRGSGGSTPISRTPRWLPSRVQLLTTRPSVGRTTGRDGVSALVPGLLSRRIADDMHLAVSSAADVIGVVCPKAGQKGGCSAPPPFDPVSIPHDIEKRGVATGIDQERNPQVSGPIPPPPQVTEPARLNLSRWRHGFKSRWDYQGNRSFWIDVTTSFKVQTRASDQRETAARRALLGAPTAGRPTSLPTATSRGPFPTEIACRPYGRLVDLRR